MISLSFKTVMCTSLNYSEIIMFPAPTITVEVNQETTKDFTGWQYLDYHHLKLNMRYMAMKRQCSSILRLCLTDLINYSLAPVLNDSLAES